MSIDPPASGPPASDSPGSRDAGAPESSTPRVRTAWHPLAFNLIRAFLPEHWQVYEEFLLSSLPPRIDIVVVRRDEGSFEITGLSALFERFRRPGRRHAIIEVKSPEDRLEPADFSLQTGYAGFYMHRQGVIDPEEVFVVTLSHGIPRPWRAHLERRYRARFEEIEPGVWEAQGLQLSHYCIDTGVASRTPGNHLLYAFTRDFLREPGRVAGLLDERERVILMQIGQQVGQWRGQPGTPFLKGYDMLDEKTEEMLDQVLRAMPLQRRLAGLKPEERLAGLKPEERLEGLKAEERLAGLKPEERLEGLKAEELVGGLKPEELEALLRAVPPELLEKIRNEHH